MNTKGKNRYGATKKSKKLFITNGINYVFPRNISNRYTGSMVRVLALTMAIESKPTKPTKSSYQSSQVGKTYNDQEYNVPLLFVLTECKFLIYRTRIKGYQQEGPEEDHAQIDGIENNRVDNMRNAQRTEGIATTERDNKTRVSHKPTLLCISLYLQIKMKILLFLGVNKCISCLLYTSPSPRDRQKSRMPSSA